MVFVSPDFSGAMKERAPLEIGYAFALPRLLARLGGQTVRRAELSRAEAYGVGILVFGICCVFAARAVLPFVRSWPAQLLFVFLLPAAMWVVLLVVYFINWLLVASLRRLGLYSAPTNNPFQHFVIICLVSLIALLFLLDEAGWIHSLGAIWLGLVGCNLLALLFLKFRHED